MNATLHTHPFVVIGATGALGSLLATQLTATRPVAVVVRNPERLHETLTQLPRTVCDLRQPADIERALDELAAPTGGLAGIVNAAGVVAFGQLGTVSPAAVEELMAVNATAVVHMLQTGARLVGDGGVIMNLSGAAAEMRLIGMGAYCASKAAASAAMRVGARELRRRHIRVIDVRVSHTETGLADRAVFGTAPAFPKGHNPATVVERLIQAIDGTDSDLDDTMFTP